MVTVTGWNFNYCNGSALPDRVNNAILDISMSPTAAILTLQEFKDMAKIEFDDEDDYITDLILLCQSFIETYTGVSLNSRTINAILCNRQGNIELPYGPFLDFTTITDKDGNDISDQIKIQGVSFAWINAPCSDYINITYTAGYSNDTRPLDLKMAVKAEIAFRYTNRTGSKDLRAGVNPGICPDALTYAHPHRRNKFI